MTAPVADPMEDFLAREKAALEALEAVEIENEDAMQVDEPLAPVTKGFNTSTSPSTLPSSAPRSSMSTTLTTFTSTATPTSPTTPRARVDTEAMKEWRTSRASEIAERDATATQACQARKNEAKRELEAWRASWKEGMEARKQDNRKASGAPTLSEWDKEQPLKGTVTKEQVDWKNVLNLMESLPRPTKDTARVLGIVKSMANEQK